MKLKYIYGGCNIKTKTSFVNDNRLYFCSCSNILVSSEKEIIEVKFLDNFLNFVKVSNDVILSGDTKGILYVIKNDIITKYKFDECIQDGFIINEGIFLVVFLKRIVLYDTKDKKNVNELRVPNIISSCCVYENILLIGNTEGSVELHDLSFNLLSQTQCHDDRIQDFACKSINDRIFIATSSKDYTIKIWELKDKGLVHIQTLVGHNDWVNQVNWSLDNKIISASSDKTIMIWNITDNFIWENISILGGASPFLNGFYMGSSVIGQSSSGSFYKFNENVLDFISGHTEEVMSLDWNGDYLLSTSLDKTCRIFFKNREIGRPLTHGYELLAGKFLSDTNLSIIIGGLETIIRVFEPTFIFYLSTEWMNENLESKMDSLNISDSFPKYFKDIDDYKMAAVPAELSLTNDVIEDYNFENVNEYLLSTTTFREIKKMYGHYFEVSDVAVSKNYIASCNKSLTKKFGGIFLWSKNFEILDYFELHMYGIIKLVFSPDEKYLCAVSKDKTSSIYEIDKKIFFKYHNVDHIRVVWDCSFSFDSKYYATCSRDRKVLIYDLADNNKLKWCIEFENEVTALDFSPICYDLSVGTDQGEIFFINYINTEFVMDVKSKYLAHSQRINALKYNKKGNLLASGGKDGLINVLEFS